MQESTCCGEGQRKRERERISSRFSGMNTEPDPGAQPQDPEIMT